MDGLPPLPAPVPGPVLEDSEDKLPPSLVPVLEDFVDELSLLPVPVPEGCEGAPYLPAVPRRLCCRSPRPRQRSQGSLHCSPGFQRFLHHASELHLGLSWSRCGPSDHPLLCRRPPGRLLLHCRPPGRLLLHCRPPDRLLLHCRPPDRLLLHCWPPDCLLLRRQPPDCQLLRRRPPELFPSFRGPLLDPTLIRCLFWFGYVGVWDPPLKGGAMSYQLVF
ncbi:hypothetical protein GOODEAATRI_012016 [Goodea atripinnis]|uniref:Uncharacterized protein n=1 Tax=Goodea atripinnis TaxID=208336 RepID=A0ABV0PMV4_9TELE